MHSPSSNWVCPQRYKTKWKVFWKIYKKKTLLAYTNNDINQVKKFTCRQANNNNKTNIICLYSGTGFRSTYSRLLGWRLVYLICPKNIVVESNNSTIGWHKSDVTTLTLRNSLRQRFSTGVPRQPWLACKTLGVSRISEL